MKKLLSISLASLLLVSTIGVTVHKHYCDSQLVAVSILPHGDEDPCDSDMPMGTNSCSDQHQHYSVDSPLVLMAIIFNLAPAFTFVAVQEISLLGINTEYYTTPKLYADIHPPPSEPNIYTRDQSFLL